jgi:plasmid stabilization system protein ParE
LRQPVVPRTVEFLDEALEEAEAATRWYADRSPTAATAFTDEIDTAIAEINSLPLAWPAYHHDTRRFLLRRFPYSVVYRVSERLILVVAVAHAHRRPGYWTKRLRQ